MPRRTPAAQAQLEVDRWNERYPPGTPVSVRLTYGASKRTVTSGPAFVSEHTGRPVVITNDYGVRWLHEVTPSVAAKVVSRGPAAKP